MENSPAKYLILFSIDGLRPDFYLDESWPAPTLQQMAREGTHARGVKGIFPSVTFPSHTTLVSGAYPANHGILYNRPFIPGDDSGQWYWYADSIRVQTLWDVVKQNGGTTAGFNWPVTVNADIDFNIADVWGGESPGAAILTARPDGFVDELEQQVLGRMRAEQVRNVTNAAPIAEYLIEQKKPNLLLIHVANTDATQHSHGREHPDVRRAVGLADQLMTRMVDAVRRAGILDETAFIVSGDHGFVDYNMRIQPNVWLTEAGLREASLGRDNWRATFNTAGGSAFLRLRNPDDRQALEKVRELLENLPASKRQYFRIFEEERLRKLGSDPHAVLAIAAADGVTMGGGTSGGDLLPGSGGSHGHSANIENMRTGFVAWGAGVREGVSIPLMRMEDIGPTGASLLGLTLPDADGAPHPAVLFLE